MQKKGFLSGKLLVTSPFLSFPKMPKERKRPVYRVMYDQENDRDLLYKIFPDRSIVEVAIPKGAKSAKSINQAHIICQDSTHVWNEDRIIKFGKAISATNFRTKFHLVEIFIKRQCK